MLKCLENPSKSLQTIITTFSLWKTKTSTYPTLNVPSKTLQEMEEQFWKHMLLTTLLLGEL